MGVYPAKGETALNETLWQVIPPDSAVVLYFGCGDGSGAEVLRRRNPKMQLIATELDIAKQEQAGKFGFPVLNSAEALLQYLENLGLSIDAWIVEQSAWQDETFTRCLRERIFSRLREGATLAWQVANVQNWQYLLRLMTGRAAGEVRHNLEELLTEWQAAGVNEHKLKKLVSGNRQSFQRFLQQMQSLITALPVPQDKLVDRLETEGYVMVGWRRMKKREPLHITAIMGETKVCARVRIDEPHTFLATLPRVTCRRYSLGEKIESLERGRQVWIWQRLLIPKDQMVIWQRDRLAKKILTVQEWDDDPLHWEEHFRQSDFFALRSAHGIQTSTPALAEYLRQFNPEVKIFPNCIAALPPLPKKTDQSVTIFYGALNRQDDWLPIMPVLNRVLHRHCVRVKLVVVWDQAFFDAASTENKHFEPFCDYPRYCELLQHSDICLLPLLPTRFNRMKSDLKFLEAAASGAVALANPTVYEDTLIDGVTGVLYRGEDEFEENLTKLIDDASLRQRLSGNAWEWVKQHRLLSAHYRERLEWYETLFERYEELTEAIRERTPEMR